ncbi:(Fe-S)-binding protein [Litorilinea aerophila]|uniref:(Fe-S)-binding protein n=1 Tax=Litorilinea aerophila TaxID=1204385 RepID=A0A540VEK8_9CHLR|nr:(Fe-S)-binding protein [Litorilinea aerophila]MCC9077147.1 (Fe-S)-binding protein [Litorilinea aerophila]
MHRKTFEQPPRRVALFVTCMVDMIYPEVGMATVELLERHGVEVIFPEEQTCCGQPAFNAGYRDEARVLARRFLEIFGPLVEQGQVDAIVAPSGSCTTMTSHFYATLFDSAANPAERRRCESLAAVTFELTEFLVDVLGVTDTGARFPGKVTYHACCHLLRELQVDAQPRTLLANVQDAELVELTGAEECCGFGGLFSIKNAGISTAMGQRKARYLAQSGADVVALCDVSCMTHINGLLSRQGQHCRAVHIAQILNSQVDVEAPPPPPAPDQEAVQQPRRWQDIR